MASSMVIGDAILKSTRWAPRRVAIWAMRALHSPSRAASSAPQPVPDYAAAAGAGVKGKRVGVPKNLIGADADSQRALDGAMAALQGQGAQPVDVMLPELDEAAQRWLALCGVEAALAHEATFPSRRSEYGVEFAALLDLGLGLSGLELCRLLLLRARVTGELERLLASIDLLLLPVMGVAAPSLAAMKTRSIAWLIGRRA